MTELHTIEVRYEDVDGRRVDVHEAARARSKAVSPDDRFVVESDVCACCDAERKDTAYHEYNVVKVSYGPSDHEREGYKTYQDGITIEFIIFAVLFLLTGLAIAAFVASGGAVSL